MSLTWLPRRARGLPVLLVAGLLAGCSLLPEPQPLRLFTLPEATRAASGEAPLSRTLRLDTPSAGAPLDGSRILVRTTPHELSAYAGARWRDDAPQLLHDHLIDAFRRDGRLATVVDDASRARSDATLVSHLGAFHSRYRDGHPEVVIRLDVQLLDESSRAVRASQRFEVVESSEAPHLDAVIDAFGRAADALASQLVDWTIARLSDR